MADFNFLPDAGRKIKEIEPSGAHTAAQSMEKGETDAQEPNHAAAARLEELLQEFGFAVSGLELEVEKETVRVSGKVKDQETKELVILAVGNIQGISKVEEQLSTARQAPEARFHTVEPADSLDTIAEKVFGDPLRKAEIFTANAPFLEKESEIYPGMVLRIPGD